MTITITEALGAVTPSKGGRMLVRIITPGVGSSGVYPPEVLEAAAEQRVFPKGTQMFANHPSATEEADRPERSIRDLAGVLDQDAHWDGTGLVAEVRTFEPWATTLAQMHDDIGVSIRASARVEESDAQGRPIIAELVEGISVDFVTRAGRGGKVLQVLESAAREAFPGGLTADDLASRIDQALPADAWAHDHTDTWVVYRDPNGPGLLQQEYAADQQGRITLTGTPRRVARRVTYDALDTPPGVAMESHPRKEPAVAQIQIDEAEHKRLTEAAEKVAAAEAAQAAAEQRAQEAEQAIRAALEAADMATVDRIITSSGAEFTVLEAKGLRSDLPRTEEGRLDVPAFEKTVTEAAAEKGTGEGRRFGLGAATESASFTEADLDRVLGIRKEA